MLNSTALIWFAIYWLLGALIVYIDTVKTINFIVDNNDVEAKKYLKAGMTDEEYSDAKGLLQSACEGLPQSVITSTLVLVSLLIGGFVLPQMIWRKITG